MKKIADRFDRADAEICCDDKALIAALDREPEVEVPAGFAARLVVRLPQAETPRPQPHLARNAGYASMTFLLAALVLLSIEASRSAQPAGFMFVAEMILLLQMSAIALWLGTRKEA